MKYLVASIVLLCASAVYAGPTAGAEVSKVVKNPNMHVSEAVYQSSTTCGVTDNVSMWVSSPVAASLYSIHVTSPGSTASSIKVYDGRDTAAASRLVTSYIPGDIQRQYFYNVSFSSMLGVDIQSGAQPFPCVDIIYRKR